jgi:transcriptional regulator with XRE-family HTH domain
MVTPHTCQRQVPQVQNLSDCYVADRQARFAAWGEWVVAGKPSPTLRRRELGARLRELRQRADLTIEEVAARLMVSATKISRLETAARGVVLRDIRDLCDVYDVDPEDRERLMRLARQSRERSWWQEYGLPLFTFVGLEAGAASILDFKAGVVPGLLQTEEYARTVLDATLPDPGPDMVQRLLDARRKRQRLLDGDQPVRLTAILDEAAVRRVVGGAAVMREQVRALVERAGLPNVEVRLLPFEAGAHPALESNFTIFEFAEDVPDVVSIEGLRGENYLESPADLTRYRRVFERLRVLALPPAESVAELTAIAGTYAMS